MEIIAVVELLEDVTTGPGLSSTMGELLLELFILTLVLLVVTLELFGLLLGLNVLVSRLNSLIPSK